jgi:hypothetical protein
MAIVRKQTAEKVEKKVKKAPIKKAVVAKDEKKETAAKAKPIAKKAPAKKTTAVKAKPAAKKAPAKKKTVTKIKAQKNLYILELSRYSPESGVVEIAGDFSEWKPVKMDKQEGDVWKIRLELDEGQYQYKYIYDGESWEVDPNAPIVPTEQGENNLLNVPVES